MSAAPFFYGVSNSLRYGSAAAVGQQAYFFIPAWKAHFLTGFGVVLLPERAGKVIPVRSGRNTPCVVWGR